MSKKDVQKEAKAILDKFSKALAAIKAEESHVLREDDRRGEGEGVGCDASFRELMFENAPKHKDGFILAEKKKW